MDRIKEDLLGLYVRTKLQHSLLAYEALDFLYDTQAFTPEERALLYECVVPKAFRELGLLTQERFDNKSDGDIVKLVELSLGINHFAPVLDKFSKVRNYLSIFSAIK